MLKYLNKANIMIDKQFLRAFTGERTFSWGKDLYEQGRVSDLSLYQDRETGLLHIEAQVSDPREREPQDVYVLINEKDGWIIDYDCGCTFFSRFRHPCNHIAAVLVKFIEEEQDPSARRNRIRNTDPSLRSLMNELADTADTAVPAGPVVLEPHIHFQYEDLERPLFSFRIGIQGKRMYIIQNISDFTSGVRRRERKKYGRELDFTHDIHYFASPCRPLLEFLLSLTDETDRYTDGSDYYSTYSYSHIPAIGRNLSLQGKYLDDFFAAAENLPLYVTEPAIRTYGTDITSLYTVTDGTVQLPVSMEQTETGWFLSGKRKVFYKGRDWLYFPDVLTKTFIRVPRKETAFEKVLDFFRNNSDPLFINKEDLPLFASVLYPVLSEHSPEGIAGFEPDLYRPKDPVFEIYLDAPQEGMITAKLNAVYDEQKFDVLAGIDAGNRRNTVREKEMDAFVSSWFNSFDPSTHRLALINDDEMTWTFLTEGIPALQEKADVYISDALKQIRVYRSPKVNIGISVSHDLLQLDLVTSDLSLKELGEILYKYDRKKRYHRLKNGSFIRIDENLDAFRDFSENMQLSAADIASGVIDLPRYRAFYLDALAQEDASIEERPDFRQLIMKMKNADPDTYTVPECMQGVLRGYQEEGFRWMSMMKDNGFGALLADEMGLGKTVQVIALIGSFKNQGRSLIVCPASLVYNWAAEFRSFMPQLRCRMISGTSSLRRNQIRSSEENEILITSYDLLKRDVEEYRNIEFACEVVDEAQYIKNASTLAAKSVKLIHARFKAALTGTPIENRLSELWSIFDYILPGYLGSYEKFRLQYESPIIRDADLDTEDRLRKLVEPFILRRTKKEVLKDLPDKLEEVYYAPLEGEQKELYDARVKRLKLMLEEQTDQEFRNDKIEILAELMKLRQICCDPSLLYENYRGNTAKREMCIDLIRKAVSGGHKVLLFSQFVTMLRELAADLQKEKIAYHMLSGETPKEARAEMVASFQKDDVPVFCISLKAGGTGLNLTAADIVIHYDPWWNTAVENQASDRAHRIGQTNAVTVYRLIMEDTIEERILQMQQEKTDLAGRILSAEGVSSTRLSRDELIRILGR